MTAQARVRIAWDTLVAVESTTDEIRRHAGELAAGYNEPTNAALMGHENLISDAEVVESYEQSIASGMRAFLLYADTVLAGDADLRGVHADTAEFAFMIGARSAQ